jgi:hypothetical protein
LHLASLEFDTVSLSHQLSPSHSRSAPQEHLVPAASVFRVVPSSETHAGDGGAVTVYDSSTAGGGETFVYTVISCATELIVRFFKVTLVIVVVDVHVLEHAALSEDWLPQSPQSLLQ